MFLDITSMSGLVQDVASTFSALFSIITGNWLLLGIIGVGVIIPLLFSVVRYFK